MKILCILLISFSLSSAIAQNRAYSLYKTEGNVNIYQKEVNCTLEDGKINNDLIFLKVENKNPYSVKVNWHYDLYFDNQCITCGENPEYEFEITLKPGQIVEPQCILNDPTSLKIFVKSNNFDNLYTFNKFELSNIKVQKATK